MKISDRTLAQIEAEYAAAYVVANDIGHVYDEASDQDVRALDVLVWATEADSTNDDGSRAIARFTVRAE